MKHEIADSIGNDAQSTDCLKSVLYELDAIFQAMSVTFVMPLLCCPARL